jgi:abortive infection bacteriophage resistance protein
MKYTKGAVTVADQIAMLRERGLVIADEPLAAHYLSTISYYRLAGYLLPLQNDKVNHLYKPGSHFEQAVDMYRFDQKLRALVLSVTELIEVSIRTRLIYTLSLQHSPWWFEDPSLFNSPDEHADFLAAVDRELEHSHEEFIRDHRRRYGDDERRPPAWKTLEVATFGALSRLYGNIRPTLAGRGDIADFFLVPRENYLSGWLQSISQVRNICAHHARLWNRTITATPRHIKRIQRPELRYNPISDSQRHKLYAVLCVMNYLLYTIDPAYSLRRHLVELFAEFPKVDTGAMGFLTDWQEQPLWKSR